MPGIEVGIMYADPRAHVPMRCIILSCSTGLANSVLSILTGSIFQGYQAGTSGSFRGIGQIYSQPYLEMPSGLESGQPNRCSSIERWMDGCWMDVESVHY